MKYILAALFFVPAVSMASGKEWIQMDVQLGVSLCTLNADDSIASCDGDATQIKETVKADLVAAGCKPACKNNDHATFTKTYVLERSDTHKKTSYDVEVIVSRMAMKPTDKLSYDIEVYITPTGGTRADTRSSLASVSDLHAFTSAFLDGKGETAVLGPDEKKVEGTPNVYLSNVQLIQAP